MPKNKYKFEDFKYLSKDELLEILELRNQDYIRVHMVNSELIATEDHLKFCESLKSRLDKRYYKITYNDKFIGVIDFQDIDYKKHSYEPGVYYSIDTPGEVKVNASRISRMILVELKLYYPSIRIKKTNLKSLLFNTMKLNNKIIKEDDEFYYLESTELNPKFNSDEDIAKKFKSLRDQFDIELKI